MANIIPSLETVLAAIKASACTWYTNCSFLYETREGVDEKVGKFFGITCTILADGVDMNYRIRFNYCKHPDNGFHYAVTSNFNGIRCDKVTNDLDRAEAFTAKLMGDACCRITGHEETCPAHWQVPENESNAFSSLSEDTYGETA